MPQQDAREKHKAAAHFTLEDVLTENDLLLLPDFGLKAVV